MDTSAKNENSLKATLYCDGLLSMAYALIALFVMPYIVVTDSTLCAFFLPLAALVPLAVMPIVYSVMHRFAPVMFGRYHLIMPISGFLAALGFALVFGAYSGGAIGACKLFFGLLLFVSASFVYMYSAYSIRIRLVGGESNGSVWSSVFVAIGLVAAIASSVGFYYYGAAPLLDAAYVAGIVISVVTIVQYLTTFYYIPKFGGRRERSFRDTFKDFYKGLSPRPLISALSVLSASATETMLVVSLCANLGAVLPVTTAGAIAAAFIATMRVSKTLSEKNRTASVALAFSCIFVSAALFISVAASGENMSFGTAATLVSFAGVFTGVGAAFAFSEATTNVRAVKKHMTMGAAFVICGLCICVATAIALFVMVVVALLYSRSGFLSEFVYGFAAAAAFAVCHLISTLAKRRKSQTENIMK